MNKAWIDTVPVLDHFAQVANPAHYVPVPDDWLVGVSDVVDSTGAIEAGRYKSVNLAGAATISAVANALGGALPLFIFSGDGARFAVPPEQAPAAADALSRVAMWVERDIDLQLRVGMAEAAEIRAAGMDVRAAFWRASDDVRYAMFTGGGLEWVDRQLKSGAIAALPATQDNEPDLTGLSCQWGPIQPSRGKIVSLIVKPVPGQSISRFYEITATVIEVLEGGGSLNPVSPNGPDVRWPSRAIALQSRIAHKGRSKGSRRFRVLWTAALMWMVFKTGKRIGRFDPKRYRREIAVNTDFRKFDDALMMTLDCSPDTVAQLRAVLDTASAEGDIRYGLHMQDAALMTCVVPSVFDAGHMHFVDGAGGGYAIAARQLRES